jgi:hypothetical protein
VGLVACQTASFDDLQVWHDPPGRPGRAASTAPQQVYHSQELRRPDVILWDRLLLEAPTGLPHQAEYSVDGGQRWHAVPADHGLSHVDASTGRIRFRLTLPAQSGPVRLAVALRTSDALMPDRHDP